MDRKLNLKLNITKLGAELIKTHFYPMLRDSLKRVMKFGVENLAFVINEYRKQFCVPQTQDFIRRSLEKN